MEIKAKCKFDLETVKALTYLTMFKKGSPQKRMTALNVLFSVLLAIVILEIILFGIDINLVLVAISGIIILLWNAYMWFFYPKVRYKALAKMKNTQNEYKFTDERIFVTTTGEEYNGEAQIEYSLFVKVYETSRYLFLYQTNNQVFIVDKNTIEGGTVEEIRNKLSAFAPNKYIVCKY